MKKHLLYCITAALIGTIFVSCSESSVNETTSETTPAVPDAESTLSGEGEVDFSAMTFIERLTYSRTQISDNLPEKDYGSADYTVAYLSGGGDPDFNVEELNGDVLNDAVYNRNLTVEDRFNINLIPVSISHAGCYTEVVTPINAGDDLHQNIAIHPGQYGALSRDGYLMCMSSLPYIDFTKPWWIADSVNSFSYKGYVYTAYGTAGSIYMMSDSPVTFFNKDLAKNLTIENLYEVVREGRWTMDYMLSLTNIASADIDGNGIMDDADGYALDFCRDGQLYRFVWSLGGRYITNDPDNGLSLNMNNEFMEKVFEATRSLTATPGIHVTPGYDNIYSSGNILLLMSGLSNINSLRDLDFPTGIIPNFKLDESQEHYLTNGGGCPMGIPVSVQDADRAALILEALSAEGYKQVVPAYYETAVKYKMADDEESAEMLDIIFTHVTYDSCRMFNDSLTWLGNEYAYSTSGFGSFMEGRQRRAEKETERNLKKLIAVIERDFGSPE